MPEVRPNAVAPSPPPTRVRWMIFGLSCGTSWLLYLHRYSWGLIKADVKAEYGLSDTQLGWIDSAFMGSYALFQVPTGALGDLLGAAVVLPVIIFAWSGMLVGLAMAKGFWSFAGVQALFGATQAGAYPNLNKVTRSWFPLSVRTTAQGFVASLAGRSGGACASLVVSTLLLGWMGVPWRSALAVIAGVGVLYAIVFRILFRDSPAQHPWANAAEQRLVDGDEPAATPGQKMVLTRRAGARASFGMLLVQQFGSAFADVLYVFWIPLFLAEAKGLGRVELGIFASLPLWGGAFGGMVGGVLNDAIVRRAGQRVARRVVGMTGKLIAAGLVATSIGIEDGRWAMVVLAGAKFFTDWSQPTVWGTVTDIGGRAAGTVFGTVNMSGSIGAFAAGPILGSIKQHFGWGPLFWTIAGVYVASGLCWLAIDPTRRLVVEAETSGLPVRDVGEKNAHE